MHPEAEHVGGVTARLARRAPVSTVARSASTLLLVAAVLMLTPVAPASAHASLVGTVPGDGVTLQQAPGEITLSFSEHVALAATHVEVADGNGIPVPVTHLRVVTEHPGDVAGGMEEPVQVVGRLPHLATGTYRVSWGTVSGDDLHESSGSFAFGVRMPLQALGPVDDTPSVVESAVRWVLLLGIALALGGLLTRSLLLRSGARAQAVVGVLKLSVAGSLAALLASGTLLVVQVVSGGVVGHEVLTGSYGFRWSLRETGLVLLALAAVSLLRGAPPGATRALTLGGGTLTCLGTALLGHAGAGMTLSTTRVAATAIHLGAALAWAGAVVCLALLVLRPHRSAAVPWVDVLRSFAMPATACVSLTAVSGIYLSSEVVSSVDAVLSTFYGRTLLVKVCLAGLAGAVGLANHRWLRGQAGGLPRRTVAVEAFVLVSVVAATAVLTSAAPALSPLAVHPEEAEWLGGYLRGLAAVLGGVLAVTWTAALRSRRQEPHLRESDPGTAEDSQDPVPT